MNRCRKCAAEEVKATGIVVAKNSYTCNTGGIYHGEQ